MTASVPPPASPDRPPCAPDERALRRQGERLATLAQAPWLHAEVARRLADKLGPIRLQPVNWIDWSAFLGAGAGEVRRHYPQAQRWIVEPLDSLRRRSLEQEAKAPFNETRSWKTLWRREPAQAWLAEDLAGAPWRTTARMENRTGNHAANHADIGTDGAQMLWANMCLHAHADLPALMSAWHRQLAVGGFLMCSGLGPDTARELRAVYRALGWPLPTIDFVDMHDLGDELVKAGFADPVMDMERLTLTWATPEALLDELRTWGGNVAAGRHPGLRTPRWRQRLLSELGTRLRRPDGRLGLTVELVYGHAIKPLPRVPVAPETRVSLDDMKRLIRKPGQP